VFFSAGFRKGNEPRGTWPVFFFAELLRCKCGILFAASEHLRAPAAIERIDYGFGIN
jgi:hypothetical protein